MMFRNIIIIFIILIIGMLIWRFLNKVEALVMYDHFDDNLFIKENDNWYNIDYNDLFYYNTRGPRSEVIIDILRPVEIIDLEPVTRGFDDIPPELVRDLNGGSQNVHDSFVQETVKKAHKKMVKTPYIKGTLDDIKNELYDKKLLSIIYQIANRDAYISNINKKETEVLRDVWEISRKNDNLKEEFKNQLLDCIDENNNLVCGTGVVTRLTSGLFINNPEELPKTKEIINQEVLSRFNKLYNEEENVDKIFIKNKIINEYTEPSMKQKVETLIEEWIDYV